MIISRTPLRISLVGGGTDMPEFYKHHPGAVISFSINKYVYLMVNKKFDNSIRVSYSKTENVKDVSEIQHDLVRETMKAHGLKSGIEIASVADIHGNGTGLGSSSAFTVGLVHALGVERDAQKLAERAWYVENKMCKRPVGKQDHYASAFGGFNHITFTPEKVSVKNILLSEKWVKDFLSHSLLLYTGITRDANNILTEQRKYFANGNIEMGKRMEVLTSYLFNEIWGANRFNSELIGEMLKEAWKIKKFYANGISNETIEHKMNLALKYGALGGKLLGAGGGGFIFLIAPPETHAQIVNVTGLRKVDFGIDYEGSKVMYAG